jgi:hypothetical protein
VFYVSVFRSFSLQIYTFFTIFFVVLRLLMQKNSDYGKQEGNTGAAAHRLPW